MAAPTFDLQSHSTASDGVLTPTEVVARAHRAGVDLLALSDHDTVDGLDEAFSAAAATGGELTLVSAVEISSLDRDNKDLHILGYNIDHNNPTLLARLALWRQDRWTRGERTAQTMRELGWEVELPLRDDSPLGRPHIAAAIFDHPTNAGRAAREGLMNSTELLVAYLIPGAPGYCGRSAPTVAEAIETIHEAGGQAILAHPYWDFHGAGKHEGVRDALENFAQLGGDGVEAFYISHSEDESRRLVELAADLDMLTTGSADFHGPENPRFSNFRNFSLYGHDSNLGPIDRRQPSR
ncbi:MAG: PHP domain-containing protein [Solirubrobacterales bacterium]|nr:PHP domain-containing protein [Solirubrobacterales bacterium]